MSSDPKAPEAMEWQGGERPEEVKEAKEGMSSPPFKVQAWKPLSPTSSDRIRRIGHPGPVLV